MKKSSLPPAFDPRTTLRTVRDTMGLEAHDKLLLFSLLTYADEQGQCGPSLPGLAADMGLSLARVQKHEAKLVQLGVLQPAPGPRDGVPTLYRVNLAALHALGQWPDDYDYEGREDAEVVYTIDLAALQALGQGSGGRDKKVVSKARRASARKVVARKAGAGSAQKVGAGKARAEGARRGGGRRATT